MCEMMRAERARVSCRAGRSDPVRDHVAAGDAFDGWRQTVYRGAEFMLSSTRTDYDDLHSHLRRRWRRIIHSDNGALQRCMAAAARRAARAGCSL